MIYLGVPYGSNFGWGVLGKEIAFAMARSTDVRVIAPPDIDQRLDDEFERYHLRRLLVSPSDVSSANVPLIQAAIGRTLDPFVPGLPPAAVGYAVFEEDRLLPEAVAQARRNYRHLVAASGYCANVLRQHGLTEVSVLPHGVDTTRFTPRTEPRTFLQDRFVIFSGGKFELRKGQDIVIRAYKVLQDRHKDVMLVHSWHNVWPKTRDTMAASPHIRYFPPRDDDYHAWISALLASHGIDLDRVIPVGPRNHRLLPDLYHATDLGIFPNRAEGGNNMVLMEYLACGKPALASYNTGHKDILRRSNAVLIESHRPIEFRPYGELLATWHDPSLDETIAKLEWCYQNRGRLQSIAKQAAVDMRAFSWTRLADGLLGIAKEGVPAEA
ncbi:MAG TPA: glycosyltransferase family 4 protein [Pirellulales bacterium]|nr:glycosyltransferase family 4 protein [Pirellulales bacterium]